MMGARELWRPIDGFEGRYEISDAGRVKSLSRWRTTKGGGKCRVQECIRRLSKDRDGYLCTTLYRDAEEVNVRVAALVASAFIGPRPAGTEVCHNNGIRNDNRVSNLRYDTPKGNQADKAVHGTLLLGERVSTAKLTARQVLAIRAAAKGDVAATATLFGVSPGTAYLIRSRKSWRHV